MYSYDMRDMLTEAHNRHFSERLFYADNVWLFNTASPCYNGNIAVSRIINGDTTQTFTCSYDDFILFADKIKNHPKALLNKVR